MKVLVTGANGYIGSKVVSRLCDLHFDVIAVDIDNSHIDARATYKKSDIFCKNEDWFSFFGSPDVCLHLAWRNGFVHDSPSHMGDLSGHYNFLTNLIDHGLSRLAVMGTMHEVGYYVGSVDENTICNPLSQYGVAKNALRQSMLVYCKQRHCILQWLRAFYIYGDDSYGNSIFAKINKAASEGKKSFPLTSGKNQYDFIHIDELSEQITAVVIQNKINGIINVCSGKPKALGEMLNSYVLEHNISIRLEYGKFPERPYDSPCIFGDNTKIAQVLSSTDLSE